MMRVPPIILVLLSLILLSGCGGDDGSSGGKDTVSGSGYSVELPTGWSDSTDEAEDVETPVRFDRVLSKKSQDGFATNVNVVRERAPEGITLDQVEEQFRRQIEGLGATNLTPPEEIEVDGEGAVARNYTLKGSGKTVRGRQIFSVHDDRVFTVSFTSLPERFEAERAEFQEILDSWRWD